MFRLIKRSLHLILLFIVLSIILFLTAHNVSKTITPEDTEFIAKIMQEAGHDDIETARAKVSFESEIELITAIQDSAFHTTPNTGLIPLDQTREPKDLYESVQAYCGDRARYIDKALRHYGFETRFATLFSNTSGLSFFETLATRVSARGKVQSHAIVEVMTSKGWLAVDTRTRWVSLDINNQPISLKELHDIGGRQNIKWHPASKEDPYFLMLSPYYTVYGLYSRHGRFYPPFTPYVPDINWIELAENIPDIQTPDVTLPEIDLKETGLGEYIEQQQPKIDFKLDSTRN